MVTFVDASKTRHKRDPGRCFRRAGIEHVGFTRSGLYALQGLATGLDGKWTPPNAGSTDVSALNEADLDALEALLEKAKG